MLSSTHIVHCGQHGCSETLSVSGADATRAELYAKAKKAGWAWPNASTQFCPKHLPTKAAPKAKAPKAKPAKKAAAKSSEKKPRKAASVPGVPAVSDRPAA